MRVLFQRVSEAQVTVGDEIIGSIGRGALLFVGFTEGDSSDELAWMAKKCAYLRVFTGEDNRMNRSVMDIGGGILAVSQFTLYGNPYKGHRPSFVGAAAPEEAEVLYEQFMSYLRGHVPSVERGKFGANMQVRLVNDGPVTFWLERAPAG
ncbi:MAG: D-tyrosyl-tRNA(Tyr) deacylase [Myxococcales bacterium]|nr:D-tyrosyl-tRNA(Tyr) deacylase [Myxococcales bacterium]